MNRRRNGIRNDSTTSDKFLLDDPRLCDYELDRIERNVLADVVSSGRLPLEDVNFLKLWESGTYFQTAPVPVLFPFDENIADVAKSTGRFRHFSYYDDVEVVHDGVRYRLLKLKSERALSVLLNWLKERGVSDSELKLAYCRGNGSDEHSDLGLGKSPLKCKTESHAKKSVKVLSKKQSAAVMASIRRYSDGSILASDVKMAFNMQIRKHGYKPSAFAKGVGLEYSFVMKWCRGELVIKPEELKMLCKHLGVANLFEDLPLTVLTKEQKSMLKAAAETAGEGADETANWEEEAYKEEVARIQPIFDRLKSHPGFYEAAQYGDDELESLVWRAIRDEKVEGSISVDELLDSMDADGMIGGNWTDIVQSWRNQYRELDMLIKQGL